tara:strand:- start:481 stop:849 length:369 start_codon:yes stop_codon:yes gene_type:complete
MIEANQQTEPTVEKQTTPEGEQKTLTLSGIISDLDNGLGRPQIKEKYELTAAEIKQLFQHPMLKNRRPKRALTKISFTLIDDVTSTETPQEDPTQLRVDTEAERVENNTAETNSFDTFELID